MSVRDSLAELATIALELNQATDTLNASITRIEQQIASTRIAVEVWDDALLGEIHHRPLAMPGRLPATRTHVRGWMIGYAPLADGWRLSARRVKRFKDKDSEWEKAPPIALCSAPRSIRAQSCARLEPLITALARQAQVYLQRARAMSEPETMLSGEVFARAIRDTATLITPPADGR